MAEERPSGRALIKLIRLFVICEGQTEQTFVRRVLKPAYDTQIDFIPNLIGTAMGRGQGGDVRYARLRPDILNTLKQDPQSYCTTMLDYYGLGVGFPGTPAAGTRASSAKAEALEAAILADICDELGSSFNEARFIPYVQMHEFEGLLFSDPGRMADGVFRPDLASAFEEIRRLVPSPEDIDDSRVTAPSKRILQLMPDYSKVADGANAALEVGLQTIRKECPHFKAWLERIESLLT